MSRPMWPIKQLQFHVLPIQNRTFHAIMQQMTTSTDSALSCYKYWLLETRSHCQLVNSKTTQSDRQLTSSAVCSTAGDHRTWRPNIPSTTHWWWRRWHHVTRIASQPTVIITTHMPRHNMWCLHQALSLTTHQIPNVNYYCYNTEVEDNQLLHEILSQLAEMQVHDVHHDQSNRLHPLPHSQSTSMGTSCWTFTFHIEIFEQ